MDATDLDASADAALLAVEKLRAGRQLEALTQIAGARAALDRATAATVTAARARGYSWQDVGKALGISKQAAQQRFGRP